MDKIVRTLLVVSGTISLVIGAIGVMVPLLPTTPFLLLAAACYIRSSEKHYNWLVNNRLFGKYIKNYREHHAIPLRTKIISISLLWITIGYAMVFIVGSLLVRSVLVIIAIGVTLHLLSFKTLKETKD